MQLDVHAAAPPPHDPRPRAGGRARPRQPRPPPTPRPPATPPAARAPRGPRGRRSRSARADRRSVADVASGLGRAGHPRASPASLRPRRGSAEPRCVIFPGASARARYSCCRRLWLARPGALCWYCAAGPLQPLAPGHRRARRAVDVAPVTGAADAHRPSASRAREDPRLGRRHRPGVPRALHVPRRARSSIRFTVHRATAAGDQEARDVTPGLHPQDPRLACHTFGRRGNCSASPPVGHF